MTIDTTGMTEAPANEATAGDIARMSDADLYKELGLGEIAGQETESVPANAEVEIERFDSDEAGADAVADEAPEGAGRGEGSEGEDAEAETPTEAQEETRLAAQFAVFQGEEEVEIPTDVVIRFAADGEDRELPLDRVVRLAQMGFYNEQRAAEIKEYREQLPQIEEYVQGLQAERDMLVEGWRRVLSGDEDYLEAERDAFLRAQSPEARAERAERELQQVRQSQQMSQQEQVAHQFVQTLAPEFEAMTTSAPEVSFEEIVGRFNILTAPLLVRGQVPPAKFREVERIVRGELRSWVDAQNEKRAATKKTQTQQVQSARAETHAAKRQVARAVQPTRGSQTGGAQPQVPKRYETASDVLADVASYAKP